MNLELINKITEAEDLIEKVNLIIELYKTKVTGFLSLGEIYGLKPLDRTEMDLVVDLLLQDGCEFQEKNVGIDLKKLAYAPTLIKVPEKKEPETIEEFFEEKKAEVEPLDIHPAFNDPSEAMIFDIADKVQKISFYLSSKPCYQLSAMTGDIEHHPDGWIKNPANYWLIEQLKKEGFRVESSDLRNKPNYKFYTVYSKEPPATKLPEPKQPQKTEDEIIEEKLLARKKQNGVIDAKPPAFNPSNLANDSVLEVDIAKKDKVAEFQEPTIKDEQTVKKTKKEKVEEVAVKEFEEDPNHAKELHEELQEMHQLVKKPWSGQHEELKSHIALLSVKYARLAEMKIDAETACIRKNAAFGRENKTAELKQYQYKDQQLAYALQEDRLHRAIEGLLKVISKQLDVLITLISTSRTEMSLAIRNHGAIT